MESTSAYIPYSMCVCVCICWGEEGWETQQHSLEVYCTPDIKTLNESKVNNCKVPELSRALNNLEHLRV